MQDHKPLEHSGFSPRQRWFHSAVHIVAIGMLGCILIPLAAVWPWGGWQMAADGPQLGQADRVRIVSVLPRGVAEQAGIRVGDEVLALNGVSVADYYRRFNLDLLRGPYDRTLPVTVSRGGNVFDVAVAYPRANGTDIAQRITIASIAFGCWVGGYLLAVAYRTSNRGSPPAGVFWMATGAVLGLFNLAMAVSVPLFTILLWVWSVLLMPLFVTLHLYYPQPLGPPTRRRRTTWGLGAATLLLIVGVTALDVPQY